MRYEDFIEQGIKDLRKGASESLTVFSVKDFADIYVRAYSRGLSASQMENVDFRGKSLDEVRGDLERGLDGILDKITPENIRDVTGDEALSDLGADYSQDFLEWMKVEHSDVYQNWYTDFEKDEKECNKELGIEDISNEKGLAEDFLFEYSNSLLRGRLSEEMHDEYFADFANQNSGANEHICRLLKGLEE